MGAFTSQREMTLIVVVSFLFLLSPVLGYVVITLEISLKAKLIIAAISIVALIAIPILVVLLAPGSAGS